MRARTQAIVIGGALFGLSAGAILHAMPAAPMAAVDNELRVVVDGLQSNAGVVRIALFNDRNNFPKAGKQKALLETPAHDGIAQVQFRNLTPGEYAVVAYHDENGNGKLDRNFIGIPKERYGFSQNMRVSFGPPRFEDAAIRVQDEPVTVDIQLRK